MLDFGLAGCCGVAAAVLILAAAFFLDSPGARLGVAVGLGSGI